MADNIYQCSPLAVKFSKKTSRRAATADIPDGLSSPTDIPDGFSRRATAADIPDGLSSPTDIPDGLSSPTDIPDGFPRPRECAEPKNHVP